LYYKLNVQLNRCSGNSCKAEKKAFYNTKKLLLLLGFSILFILTYISLEYQENIDSNNIIIINDF